MMKTNKDLAELLQEYREFIGGFKTLLIATTNAKNKPEASYAPYVELEGHYYIFISTLAAHTQNLLQTQMGSLLFIEDEDKTNNLFARKRVNLHCTAEELARDAANYQLVLGLFHERFGKFMQLLATLPDFHLFCLSPQSGNYVAGFGQAYTLNGSDLSQLQHRHPDAGNVRPS